MRDSKHYWLQFVTSYELASQNPFWINEANVIKWYQGYFLGSTKCKNVSFSISSSSTFSVLHKFASLVDYIISLIKIYFQKLHTHKLDLPLTAGGLALWTAHSHDISLTINNPRSIILRKCCWYFTSGTFRGFQSCWLTIKSHKKGRNEFDAVFLYLLKDYP